IAEAAIASGFMGVLLLDSLRDFLSVSKEDKKYFEETEKIHSIKLIYISPLKKIIFGAGFIIFILISLSAIWDVPDGGGLAKEAKAMISKSGVSHPVTAVLLNYRAYDTWLEIGVILMGLWAIFAAGGLKQFRKVRLKSSHDPLLRQVILIFTPVLFLFGGFLLYYGKMGPGGAFQAAVLWGAIGIMLHLGGWSVFTILSRRVRYLFLTIGLSFFLIVGLVLLSTGRAFFEYPVEYAGIIILMIETMAAISIASALMTIFAFLTK
ncbi:MAG: hypothetical protein JJT78_04545, partial [Leptospira sp.]|nr:hypothetical protein [Leptospira sp.]